MADVAPTPMLLDALRGGDVSGDFGLFWRHAQQAVRMAAAAATHHSYDKSISHACTPTDDEVPAATCAATAPSPVYEYVAPRLLSQTSKVCLNRLSLLPRQRLHQ